MAKSVNSVTLEKLRTTAIRPQRFAVGVNLAHLQRIIQVQEDDNAPHFVEGNEPTRDGRAYEAKDGTAYYRPGLKLSWRTHEPIGPDVRLLKDSKGAVWLHFTLNEDPPARVPNDAIPFNVSVDDIRLEWKDTSGRKKHRLFDAPTLSAADPEVEETAAFSVHVGAKLDPEEVETIYRAMRRTRSAASIVVRLSYGYWIDEKRIRRRGGSRSVKTKRFSEMFPVNKKVLTTMHNGRFATFKPKLNLAAAAKAIPFPRTKSEIASVRNKAKVRDHRPDFARATLTRRVSFSFDPELEQNRAIFSALETDDAVDSSWSNSGFGWIRRASFPNTVYRLPDEVRLAYNPDFNLPHMSSALYENDAGDPRVRVTMAAAPWHDPKKVVGLQDSLYTSTAGALAAPDIVVGGYEAARFRLTSAFPEEIRSLDAEGSSVSLDGGFKITLDLSLEFYKFLCELVTGPVGLTGEVIVTLETAESDDDEARKKIERIVPVRLNLDDLATLPLELHVDPDTVSPKQIGLENKAGADISLDGCAVRLLQHDPNSVAPIEVFDATPNTLFPTTIPKGSTLTVDVHPEEDDDELLWNAVAVNTFGQRLVEEPTDVLHRIHQISSSAALTWRLTIECPPFMAESVPEAYAALFKVEVRVSRPGFAAEQLVLGRHQPSGQIHMQRTLNDILSDDALGVGRFTYQVRNVYFDRQGEWSEPKDGEGSNLFVFPNPVEER